MKLKGIFYTVLSAILFGLTPVIVNITYSMGSNAETVTFFRNFLVIPVLLIIMLISKIDFRITKQEFLFILVFGALGRGMTTLLLYASYDYIGISTATTLHFLYPVFVALLCRIVFREKLSTVRWIALISASAGVFLFIDRSGTFSPIGLILAVISGISYAVYMIALDKTGLKNMNPTKLSFYMAIVVSGGMLVYNIPTKEINFLLPPKAMILTFIVAISTSYFAVALLQLGVKYLNATMAAIFSLFEPITGNISGIIFLEERLSPEKIVGSIIILVAAVILAATGKKESNEPKVSQSNS